MITQEENLIQGSEAWHSWRRAGLGGSDAPVIEGISPYRTRRELYFEKTGKPVDSEESNEFIFAKGHKVEDLIRDEFQKLVKAEMKPACIVHPKFSQLRASLDGFHPSLGVLEAKLVGQEVLEVARGGDLPAHHYSQMQHQFEVSGANIGQWFGHDGKKNGVLLEIKRNPEYIKRLLDQELEFWEMIKTGKVPALSERDYLEPEDQTLLIQLKEAKELAENAAIQYETMRDRIANSFGHPRIAGGGIKLFKVVRQGTIGLLRVPEIATVVEDAKSKLDPAYLEGFRSKSSESWTIRIEGAKKGKLNG